MIIKTLKVAKRIIIIVFGFTTLLVGVVLSIPLVPGPGILIILGGLAILAAEFVWARKLLERFQDHGARLRDLLLRRKKSEAPGTPPAEKSTLDRR